MNMHLIRYEADADNGNARVAFSFIFLSQGSDMNGSLHAHMSDINYLALRLLKTFVKMFLIGTYNRKLCFNVKPICSRKEKILLRIHQK